MKMLYRLTIILLLSCSVVIGQESGDSLLLKDYIIKYGQAEVIVDYPGINEATRIGRLVSVSGYRNGKLHIVLSNSTLSDFLSLGLIYKILKPDEGKGVVTAADMSKALDWQSYPTYTQYDSIMRKFASDYPALCRLDTIGESINGKHILVVKISDNVHVNEPDEPEVFYSSTMHGDELAGFVLMMRLVDYLLKNYASDSFVQYLVDNLQIYINPLANPDGTYRTGNEILNPTRANANGRDLNRNFPDPLQPGVVQEKENVDMIAFMRDHRFILSANFHSGEEVVNYPWDRWSFLHADDEWLYRLSRAYADTVHVYAPIGYMSGFNNGVVRGSVWYVIYGGRQDFVTYELQGREVTIELDDTKQTPASQLEAMWEYNHRSLLNYLSFALKGVRGRVTNFITGEPIEARIFIPGHDIDSSHISSSPLSGNYFRMLNDGVWSFEFSAPGFRDTLVSNIEVNMSEQLVLDVEMVPMSITDDTLRTDRLLVFPNPSTGDFRILLPESFEGVVLVDIITSTGIVLHSETVNYELNKPFYLSRNSFSSGVYLIRARSLSGKVIISRAVILNQML